MKELELSLRIRNNRLKERREALGMTQGEFAAAVGMNRSTYGALECLRLAPLGRSGEWKECVLQLARFHCVEPEELFPSTVLKIKTSSARRKIDGVEIGALLSGHAEPPLIEGPEEVIDRRALMTALKDALVALPPIMSEVLRSRFGLDDVEPRTLEAIGEELGVGRTRVRQIEIDALERARRTMTTGTVAERHEYVGQIVVTDEIVPCPTCGVAISEPCRTARRDVLPLAPGYVHLARRRDRVARRDEYVAKLRLEEAKLLEERKYASARLREALRQTGEVDLTHFGRPRRST